MKKLFILPALFFAGAIITAFTGEITSIAIGTSLPQAEAKLQDAVSGNEVTLNASKQENGLLVVFSCNTCPFVIKHQAAILETGKLAKASKVGYILVNSNEAKRDNDDSFGAMKTYASKQGYDFAYAVDKNSSLADAFGATRTPEAFLFDKNLKLVYKGAYTDDSDPANAKAFYLNDAIKALRDGKEIAVTSSKSVGCGIKRVTLKN
jgi:hypothetical protein